MSVQDYLERVGLKAEEFTQMELLAVATKREIPNGALAIPVVVYGNRNYDDALIELKDILEFNGFKVIAGGAFIGQFPSNML